MEDRRPSLREEKRRLHRNYGPIPDRTQRAWWERRCFFSSGMEHAELLLPALEPYVGAACCQKLEILFGDRYRATSVLSAVRQCAPHSFRPIAAASNQT